MLQSHSKTHINLVQMLLLMVVMCFSCLAYSEVATATDETAEAVVLGKIVQQQHPQNANPIPRSCRIHASLHLALSKHL